MPRFLSVSEADLESRRAAAELMEHVGDPNDKLLELRYRYGHLLRLYEQAREQYMLVTGKALPDPDAWDDAERAGACAAQCCTERSLQTCRPPEEIPAALTSPLGALELKSRDVLAALQPEPPQEPEF